MTVVDRAQLPDRHNPEALLNKVEAMYQQALRYGTNSTVDAEYWHAMSVLFRLTPELIALARRAGEDT